MSELKLDGKKLSKEEMDRALTLLQNEKNRKQRIANGEIKSHTWADMTPEQKEKAKQASKRRSARIRILCAKAAEAGIVVTDAEVEAEMGASA